MMIRRLRSLDIQSLDVSADGLKDFTWPISWKEQAKFRDHLIGSYAAVVRERIDRHDEEGDLLAILAMEFVQEAMRGWYAAILMRRFAQRGEQVVAPWLNGAAYDDPAIWQPKRDRIDFLRNRFPASTWRALLRPLIGLMQDDGMSWTWPQVVDFRNRIITTNASHLIRQHADSVGEKPALVSLRHWFGDASDALPNSLADHALHADTVAQTTQILVDAAALNGDELPATLLRHLENWLNAAAPICRWYLRWLLRHPKLLPARLWTGSGGYIFRRILHMATRRTGGQVWSHDHGSGLGLFGLPDTNLTEFTTPDTFVTFSPKQAEGYKLQRRDDFRLCTTWPEVTSVKISTNAPLQCPRAGTTARQRIVFIANQYRGEKLPITPIEFDVVAADWQARLFAQCQSLGHDVQMRAHPDSTSPPPENFQRVLGVAPATGSFTEALGNADIIILDYLHTTVLQEVLLSGKPVLTFEFGHCPPNPVAGNLLARRIRFIPGWYDANNRAQTDWHQLAGHIEAACDMAGDNAFLELF
ncbi:MAG: hypothetical protein KG075_16840 [Alphaproteobacteria bacterium]|nr:hypothetical protein [Alphaproteobacteria bacterium]